MAGADINGEVYGMTGIREVPKREGFENRLIDAQRIGSSCFSIWDIGPL